jgi:trigger factor
VQSRVEDLSPVVKKLQIELEQVQVKEEFDRAVGELSRTVKLKGYRAGKVPRRLVERYYGDDIKNQVAQRLVQGTLFAALGEHKLEPVATPRVENGEVNPEAPFKYTATIEVKPVVDPKDYFGLAGPKLDAAVAEAEIDERLEQMRREHSTFAPVEGRDVVEPGDVVLVDYEGFVDGAPLRGAKRDGVMLEAIPGSLLDNKAEALVGAKVGEERALGATFGADYQVEELRGKEAQFKAQVKGIKLKTTPALDDAFAKDLGVDTLEELKARIRKELEETKKDRGETTQREAILSALIEKNPVEAPPALVERNVDAMLQGMFQGFQGRGMDLSKLGINLDRLRDDLRGRAQLEVKGFLLLEAIAEKEKVEISDADLDAHYEKLAGETGQTADKVKQAFRRAEQTDSLRARLKQDKAYKLVLERAALS